jgi:hypothetical protein
MDGWREGGMEGGREGGRKRERSRAREKIFARLQYAANRGSVDGMAANILTVR